jgi:hypothetical protein
MTYMTRKQAKSSSNPRLAVHREINSDRKKEHTKCFTEQGKSDPHERGRKLNKKTNERTK